jgi:hypothetical protein
LVPQGIFENEGMIPASPHSGVPLPESGMDIEDTLFEPGYLATQQQPSRLMGGPMHELQLMQLLDSAPGSSFPALFESAEASTARSTTPLSADFAKAFSVDTLATRSSGETAGSPHEQALYTLHLSNMTDSLIEQIETDIIAHICPELVAAHRPWHREMHTSPHDEQFTPRGTKVPHAALAVIGGLEREKRRLENRETLLQDRLRTAQSMLEAKSMHLREEQSLVLVLQVIYYSFVM